MDGQKQKGEVAKGQALKISSLSATGFSRSLLISWRVEKSEEINVRGIILLKPLVRVFMFILGDDYALFAVTISHEPVMMTADTTIQSWRNSTRARLCGTRELMPFRMNHDEAGGWTLRPPFGIYSKVSNFSDSLVNSNALIPLVHWHLAKSPIFGFDDDG